MTIDVNWLQDGDVIEVVLRTDIGEDTTIRLTPREASKLSFLLDAAIDDRYVTFTEAEAESIANEDRTFEVRGEA